MSTSHNPLRDSRLHRTGATLRRHAGRLKQGALLLTALAAIYAIWLGVGLPALPIIGGHSPRATGTPFVAQIDTPAASRIDLTALLTKQALRKRLVVSPRPAAPHAAHPSVHLTGGPATATASPPTTRLTAPDTRGPAREQTTEPLAAQSTAGTSTTTTPTAPPPPAPTPQPPITLPEVPQVPKVPQVPPVSVPPLPQTPEVPEIPAAPQVTLPSAPQVPAQTTPALPLLP
jgi:hypothetical protein